MNIEVDESLLEDEDELDADAARLDEIFSSELDAKRRIERYRELKQLRHFLDDPDFEYDFD